MTEGWGQECGRNDKGAIGMATNSFYPSVVIPAQAGIQEGGPGCQAVSGVTLAEMTHVVIPARRECYCVNHWIPAFAGMTEGWGQEFGRNGKGAIGMATNSFYPSVVIPAQAGIHACIHAGEPSPE